MQFQLITDLKALLSQAQPHMNFTSAVFVAIATQVKSCPLNRPWRLIGLGVVKDPT
jgi:hypothetical protein